MVDLTELDLQTIPALLQLDGLSGYFLSFSCIDDDSVEPLRGFNLHLDNPVLHLENGDNDIDVCLQFDHVF